ncbi:MAG: SpoIID/LytB domain-containing protein [Oscillospiraceae bacterium]
MRKKFVQFAAFVLALVLLPVLPVTAVPAEESETVIRVGLCYGSSAMEGSNLLNSTGSGYRFGYYDNANQFIELASTAETAISVVKTTNVGYTANPETAYCNYSESLADTASVAVGCYHLQLPGGYATYANAFDAASAYNGGFVAYIGGIFYVRVGSYLTKSAAEAAAAGIAAEIVGTSSYGVSVVATGTNTILFQYDDLGSGTGLGVQPDQTNGSEKPITWFKGNKWHGGFRYERIDGGNLTVVNLVPLEDYIRGILPYEMSNSWPLEALKAQAVCARSYTMTNLNRHSGSHFDICNTTHCQVYYGTGSANANTDRAVDETYGQYAWYDGKICQAFYHSCDGGATENSGNVWNDDLPYLQGVSDPYESLVEDKIPGYSWTKTYTGKELQDLMINNGRYTSCGEVVDIRVTKTTPTGNVYSVTVTDVNGKSFTVSKGSVRTVFGVNSLRYTISGGSESGGYSVAGRGTLDSISGVWAVDGNGTLSQINNGPVYAVTGDGIQAVTPAASSSGASGTFVFSGTGKGHNVGMSQWGAYAMAMEGYTYEEILHFYFTGIEIR